MKDIILYIPDLVKFRKQGVELSIIGNPLFSLIGSNLSYNVEKTPVKYLNNESVCLVKGLDSDLDKITTAIKIGECVGKKGFERYEFISEEYRLTYERIRGSLNYTYEIDGIEVKGKHPYMIGVFA